MRLRTLCIALVLGTTAGPANVHAAGISFPASQSTPAPPFYVGVIGEVQRPGVYEAPAGITLTQLIQWTGGTTRNANGSVRIIRGGRVTEQSFLTGGSSSLLFPGDLVAVERGRRSFADNQSSPSEIQVALLNVIDRPVVIKMAADQATVARIVQILGQPAGLCAKTRVIVPSGSALNPATETKIARRLESGSAVIFPAHAIRAVSGPAFPEPIVVAKASPPTPAADGSAKTREAPSEKKPAAPPTRAVKAAQSQPGTSRPLAENNRRMDRGRQPLDDSANARQTLSVANQRPSWSPMQTANAVWGFDVQTKKASWTPGVLALISTIAVLAAAVMTSTIASMVGRRSPPAIGRHWRRFLRRPAVSRSFRTAFRVSPPPMPSVISRIGRPLRIDARQPITKLSIDLAVLDRSISSSR